MNKSFEFTKILNGDADRAWEILSRLDGVDQWFPMVSTCRLDTSGPATRRYCGLANGTDIEETIVGVDPDQRIVYYTVDKGLPVDRYGGSFQIRSRPDGRDEIYWRVEVEASAEMLEQIAAMLDHAAEAALTGLDDAARQAA